MKCDKQPDEPETTHRVVEIKWLPRSSIQWATFTASRLANGALWSTMVAIHERIRRGAGRWKWPTKARWEAWAKGKFPCLSAQSVQQTVGEFVECLNATTAKRKAQRARGEEVTAEYPRKRHRYRDVTYTNQDAKVADGFLKVGHGRDGRPFRIRIPKDFELPGRVMEVRVAYGVVRVVCEVPEPKVAQVDENVSAAPPPVRVITGNDIGVNTILAATDGITAIVVSGKEAKAIVQYRNKQDAALTAAMAKLVKGSNRWKRLARRRHRVREKCKRKLRDLAHKATRAVADMFPNVKAFIGEPFNDAAAKMNRVQAQQVSQMCGGKVIKQLKYKSPGTKVIPEPYTSQTCPACLKRNECRGRVYRCRNRKCGLVAPRDVVGALNIRCLGMYGEFRKHQFMPTVVKFVRPLRKYRGGFPPPRSSSGTLASSSRTKAQCAP